MSLEGEDAEAEGTRRRGSYQNLKPVGGRVGKHCERYRRKVRQGRGSGELYLKHIAARSIESWEALEWTRRWSRDDFPRRAE